MATRKAAALRLPDGTKVEELPPTQRLAHELVTKYNDLTPSVQRIMTADLDDDQRLVALTAFETSLGQVGDPNRDPRHAIEAARAGTAGV